MNRVRRIFVEKKPKFDVEAKNLLSALRAQLGLEGLKNVRVLVRYDVAGVTDAEWETACVTVFSEPMVDRTYSELPENMGTVIVRELLPGQYDQRADSAAQCVQFLTQGEQPQVRVATVFGLIGELSAADIRKIQSYLINPVDSCVGQMEPYTNLDLQADVPPDVPVLTGFTSLSREDMDTLRREMGLAMSLEDALFVAEHFAREHRDPTLTELRVIDTYWSDHCRHTTFLTELTDVSFEGVPYVQRAWDSYQQARRSVYGARLEQKPTCLMDLATMGMKLLRQNGKLDDLDESEEINACSIRVDACIDGKTEPWLVMFKNETHNHPTEIEPFGGAATCLGGAIRDPLSGRSYVYHAMRVTGSADPRVPLNETLADKLPQRTITTSAAQGFSSYGNQIGLATGMVSEVYHPGYVAKRMEIGAVVGAAPAANVVRERPVPGDIVLLIGGATGRDGCGGATGSSKAHTSESLSTCGAEVQKGNPITERKIQRLFRKPHAARRIKRCNDFGAGGVCVAVGELAEGLLIDLDRVPIKYDGIDGTELAISESQERMAVVIAPEDLDAFIALSAEENLTATKIATVTDDATMRMFWRGKEILHISREFLDTNGVRQRARARIAAPKGKIFLESETGDVKSAWLKAIGSLNGCSQRGLSERFDSTVGAGTVLMPFSGRYQHTPAQAMAARLPVTEGKTDTGTVMAYGFDPDIAQKSPFHGGTYAVVESLARLACAGGDVRRARLTFQEYFPRLNDDPARWGMPLGALLGAFTAQKELNVPSIGGKDSMSGSFEQLDVPPTLVSFAIVPADMRQVCSGEWKQAGSTLALISIPTDSDELPDYQAFLRNCDLVHEGLLNGNILSAHTLSRGGLAETAVRMAVGNMLGAKLDVDARQLFTYRPGSMVVELRAGYQNAAFTPVGRVTEEPVLRAAGVELPLTEALRVFEGTLENVFPIHDDGLDRTPLKAFSYTQRSTHKPQLNTASPRVLIPVFPGTNCEYDTRRAFERAGAIVNTLVIRNRSAQDIAESVEALQAAIDNAQIIALPGGFSAGDEPDGSGKFIATALRTPRVADAIHRMLYERDGLMLGICNGFQALIKLGLVPYGRIQDMQPNAPTLTFNRIGRHQSRIVRTRVASVLSPWMSGVNVGDIISVPISHGEGRFVCPEGFETLVANGQIATQYVDDSGAPTWDIDYNPNGSMQAVEGITSPDGRILGKMGHNERWQPGLLTNVPGNYDSKIFESGVLYFK